MSRMHKPDDEKRSLVVIAPGELEDWLACRDVETARSFLRHYPAESMKEWAAPQTVARKAPEPSPNLSLF